jgi:sulfotransferase
MPKLHFISGLPRSGSTLLAAVLRQNPRFHATIQSPLADLVANSLRVMSTHESALLVTDTQRHAVLGSMIAAYYSHLSGTSIAFDTGRTWTAMLPTISAVVPDSRVICCIRNPAWIVDSFERIVQRNALRQSRMFGQDGHNLFGRADILAKGVVGTAVSNLRQAWFGEHACRLVAVRYDSLVARPSKVIAGLYDAIGERQFDHDFEHLNYEEAEFDAWLGAPGLHRVVGRVEAKARETILPPDVFRKYDDEFWSGIGSNPRHVTIL